MRPKPLSPQEISSRGLLRGARRPGALKPKRALSARSTRQCAQRCALGCGTMARTWHTRPSPLKSRHQCTHPPAFSTTARLTSAVRATAAEPALPSLRAHSRDHKEQLGGVASAAGPSGAEVCVFLDKSMPRARGELPTRAGCSIGEAPCARAAAKRRTKQEQRWRQGGRLGAVLHGARCARVARVLQIYFADRVLDVGSTALARAASSARLGPCPGP